MTFPGIRWARPAAIIAALGILASCGIPQVGPSKRQIFNGSVNKQGDAFVVFVDDHVTRTTSVAPARGFSNSFLNAAEIGSDTINSGDVLSITVWENVENGLLAQDAQNAALLEEVQVDGTGFIFVPYAGRIRASGNSPDAIRRLITAKLEEQTPDPQVQVRRLAATGASVSLVGGVGHQGVYPIERPTRTLASMLAQAGGVSVKPETAQITLMRGSKRGYIWFQDLYDNPKLDIALRNGDRILVAEDTRSFTALGATGSQARVPFTSQNLSALEAIAQVGGLQTNAADPTGIFIFRNEPAVLAAQVLGRNDINGTQRFAYVLDLTQPNGMFVARDFVVRDGDTLFVTEAPLIQWNKTIAALAGQL